MDINVFPRSEIAPLTPKTNTTVALSESVAPVESVKAEQNPPALQVVIRQEPTPSPVYTEPLASISRLRDDSHTGVAARATSQVMLSSLSQMADGKAPFSVASVFSQISSLSKETTEYRNEARQFKVPQKLLTEKFSPDFAAASGNKAEAVKLNVQTKDGDNIQIQISRVNYKDGSTGLDFSFVVDGTLSEAEQKALGQLSEKLAQTSDAFFRTGTTELRGLQDIDTSVISGFSLTLRRPAGDSFEEHSYDYRIDDVAKTQTLKAENTQGYKVDITSNLNRLSSGENADTQVLQQYIDLIRRAGDDSGTTSDSQRFMLDAFSGFFSTAEISSAKNSEATRSAAEKSIAAFDSGLPDFKATFRSPVVHNRNNYSQASSMVLTLEQQTQIEESQGSLLIKQESSYELINNRFEPLPGMERPDFFGGNYLYVTQKSTGNTSRMLSMTGDRVNNIWVEQEAADKKTVSRFENHKMVDKDTRSYEDRNVQDFAELLEKYNKNTQQLAVEDLLMSSKERLFLSPL